MFNLILSNIETIPPSPKLGVLFSVVDCTPDGSSRSTMLSMSLLAVLFEMIPDYLYFLSSSSAPSVGWNPVGLLNGNPGGVGSRGSIWSISDSSDCSLSCMSVPGLGVPMAVMYSTSCGATWTPGDGY